MSAAAPEEAAWLDYRLRWHAGLGRPGKHATQQGGSGGDYCGVRPFWQMPDARRIDVRRSAIDPYGEILVRETEHRSAIAIVVAVDMSRSMRPDTDTPALASVAALAEAAARSALRGGDRFGLLAFDSALCTSLCLPATRARGAVMQALATFAAAAVRGRSAQGMLDLAAHLPARRCLVLLVSDFLAPLPMIDTALTLLARHDVAPILLQTENAADLPRFGLLRVRDVESGAGRLMLMRPGLRHRWQAVEAERVAALQALFLRHGRPAFMANGRIDLVALSEHLMDA